MTNAIGEVGLQPITTNTLGYAGSRQAFVPVTHAPRDPTIADIQWPTGTEWCNSVTQDFWKLHGFVNGDANWKLEGTGGIPGGTVVSLSDTASTKVFPDVAGNIQLTAGAGITVVSTPASNLLTIALSGGGAAIDQIAVQASTGPGTNPVIGDGSGQITLNGTIVANHNIPLQSDSLAANTLNIEAQYATTVAAIDGTKAGMAAFNSAQFTDTGSGFISLIGGATPPALGLDVDANTGPGTDPVVPNGSGNIIVTGAQVAAGTVGTNVIRTDSLAANTCTIEIQRSTTNATTDVTKNGVSHFSSGQFDVDVNGFVTLLGGGTAPTLGIDVDASTGPGTDPVIPNGSGNIIITGAQVATGIIGANVIRTNSLAANTTTIQIQQASTAAAKDTTLNGVCHFKTGQFTVDEGFVSLVSVTGGVIQQVRTSTTTYSTIATAIPFDDTIPQVGEGTQLFTVTITPTSASSILEFDMSVMCGMNSSAVYGTFAIFQDGASNAIFATSRLYNDAEDMTNFCFKWYMTAGTTSATTFTVRCGPSSTNLYINGYQFGRRFGGVASSSFYVTEYGA